MNGHPCYIKWASGLWTKFCDTTRNKINDFAARMYPAHPVLNPALTYTLLFCQLVLCPATVKLVKILVETPGNVDHFLQVLVR